MNRVATLQGIPDAVAEALRRIPPSAHLVGVANPGRPRARAVPALHYAHGPEVAAAVRAEVIRQATARRSCGARCAAPGRQPLPLRARFDDPEPFEE